MVYVLHTSMGLAHMMTTVPIRTDTARKSCIAVVFAGLGLTLLTTNAIIKQKTAQVRFTIAKYSMILGKTMVIL